MRSLYFLALIISLCFLKVNCFSQAIDTATTYQYVMNKQRIVFKTRMNFLPFTIINRPFGCDLLMDIGAGFETFNNKQLLTSYYYSIPKNKSRLKIDYNSKYSYNIKIDTISNYFVDKSDEFYRSILNFTINDSVSLDLSQDSLLFVKQQLFYSHVLSKSNEYPLTNVPEMEIMRIVFPIEQEPIIEIQKLIALKLNFISEDSIKLSIKEINIENFNHIWISDSAYAFLSRKDIKDIKKRISTIEFEKLNELPNTCNSDFSDYLQYSFEHKSHQKFCTYMICHNQYISNDKKIQKQIIQIVHLSSILELLGRKYFAVPDRKTNQ